MVTDSTLAINTGDLPTNDDKKGAKQLGRLLDKFHHQLVKLMIILLQMMLL
jgi:hypothetical protein